MNPPHDGGFLFLLTVAAVLLWAVWPLLDAVVGLLMVLPHGMLRSGLP